MNKIGSPRESVVDFFMAYRFLAGNFGHFGLPSYVVETLKWNYCEISF